MSQRVVKRRASSSRSTGRQWGAGPSKKPRLAAKTSITESKGKQRAFERATIPIPCASSDDEQDISDQDIHFFEKNKVGRNFLDELDHTGIARSKRELERLHKQTKPARLAPKDDDLPSMDSPGENITSGNDAVDSSGFDSSEGDAEPDNIDDHSSIHNVSDFDAEQHYERNVHKRQCSRDPDKTGSIAKLPIKLADGRIVETGGRFIVKTGGKEGEVEDVQLPEKIQSSLFDGFATGARFGRLAVASVIGTRSRAARIVMAKEQIAGICNDILADPESSIGLLRRLHTFSLAEIVPDQSPTPLPNDPFIRRLAIMSQLVVFRDIIPGYRIRPLTIAEKAEKVSQMVGRTREWEQGLVSIYQAYLKALESEFKGKTEFAGIALRAMCTLLVEATHFNFRTNLIRVIVARLGKVSWDTSSELCLQTLISVFRGDITGLPSLEIVRLLNRMVKERKFNVHENSLSCLLHLKLESELRGIRASETSVDKELVASRWGNNAKTNRKRSKGKKIERPYLSKKAMKALKEKKEIEEQMREAGAEVNREERANTCTEILKLVFVLYFRILKAPYWTPLLPSALQGLARYAHLVNIDFFKDLLQVLKNLVARRSQGESVEVSDDAADEHSDGHQIIRYQLLCIATAFELLSGQGEALNIDLHDFVNHLYALILPISLQSDIESIPHGKATAAKYSFNLQQPTVDLLFRALSLVFPARASRTVSPLRAAAFAKRLVISCLSFPPATALRSLDFVRDLFISDPRLLALLSTDDRTVNGTYRPDLSDPQLSNPFGASFWELSHLAATHWDGKVREKALNLSQLGGS